MSNQNLKPAVVSHHSLGFRSQTAYVIGFISSVVLTVVAFGVVELHSHREKFSRMAVIAAIITLAVIQFFIQMFCFLHLGRENKPRWKLLVFIFMVGTVLILVLGSLWIMTNLNYHMTQHQLDQYLHSQDGL